MNQLNRFFLKGAEKEPLHPNEYGRWTARWGRDFSMGLLRDLSDSKYKDHQKINAILENVLPFLMHSSALYASVYNSYAVCFLGVSADVSNSIRQGVTIGFTEWLMSEKSFDKSMRLRLLEVYPALYEKYVMTLVKDFYEIQERDPAVFYPYPGKADEHFLNFMISVYWADAKPSAVEEKNFDFLHITDTVIGLYAALKNNIGISFR